MRAHHVGLVAVVAAAATLFFGAAVGCSTAVTSPNFTPDTQGPPDNQKRVVPRDDAQVADIFVTVLGEESARSG